MRYFKGFGACSLAQNSGGPCTGTREAKQRASRVAPGLILELFAAKVQLPCGGERDPKVQTWTRGQPARGRSRRKKAKVIEGTKVGWGTKGSCI